MNSGNAANAQDAFACQMDVAIAFSTGTEVKIVSPTHPTPSKDKAIQSPDPKNAKSATRRTRAICAVSGDILSSLLRFE